MNQTAKPDPDYPVYRVKAKCRECGKTGKMNSFRKSTEPINAVCGDCVGKHERKIQELQQALLDRTRKKPAKKPSPSSTPSTADGATHWTDRQPWSQ